MTSCPACIGCALRYYSETGKQQHFCTNRIAANLIGSYHIGLSTAIGIILSMSRGDAIDMRAVMRFELSGPEIIMSTLVTVASILALFLFSTRESAEDEQQTQISQMAKVVFLACWLIGCLIITFNSDRIHHFHSKRTRCRASQQHNETVALPPAWSCIIISLSFFSFTAPQIIRCVFRVENLKGVLGAFSNLCFVAHLCLLTSNERYSTRRISVFHLATHVAGVAFSIRATLPSNILFSFNVALRFLVGTGVPLFDWMITHVILSKLRSRNPKLHAELPVTIFRWLTQKGGLAMGMYCYFEAAGVGYDTDTSLEDITPWLYANSTMVTHFTLATVLCATVVADENMSLKAVLKGQAPLYITLAFAALVSASLIPVAQFSGRELATRAIYRYTVSHFLSSVVYGSQFFVS